VLILVQSGMHSMTVECWDLDEALNRLACPWQPLDMPSSKLQSSSAAVRRCWDEVPILPPALERFPEP